MSAVVRALRPAWAEIDLGAVRHNVARLAEVAAPAAVCAVVKADGYGHGAVAVARAALQAGARGLAVATVAEGVELAEAGVAAPTLVLSEPSPAEMDALVAYRLRTAVYSQAGIEELAKAVARAQADALPVHLKVDTGMHRVGVSPEQAVNRARGVLERPELELEGVWTHLAVADEPAHPFTSEQLARFARALRRLRRVGARPAVVHAANSAGALAHPAARYDLVRVGIATYGLAPSPALAGALDLRPAMSVKARVAHVQVVPAGEGVSYGLRARPHRDTVVATVPLGYADGLPRRLSAVGGQVLVGGRRRPLLGTVTMDQCMVDCGPGAEVAPGDEVVLLGRQGDQRIGAEEWAERLGTISYEVVCGLGPRVPRHHL